RYALTISEIFFSSSTIKTDSFFPVSIVFFSNQYCYQSKQHSCKYIYHIMRPQVNCGKNQGKHKRQEKSEKPLFKPKREIEHRKGDTRMAAREGVPLDPLKPVQEFLKGPGDQEPLEFRMLQVVESEPRPEGRHQEIACVGKIKAEHDEENRTAKCGIVLLHFQYNTKSDRQKVVACICQLHN